MQHTHLSASQCGTDGYLLLEIQFLLQTDEGLGCDLHAWQPVYS
jgi:hypothetical protein